MPVLVDSCVLLDVLTQDPTWFEWSTDALVKARDTDTLVINAVIYAEIAPRFASVDELEAALPASDFNWQPISREAAFLASRCFLDYKKRGGSKVSCLPDFFIGAHAVTANLTLVTRDARRFRTYFPDLVIIHP